MQKRLTTALALSAIVALAAISRSANAADTGPDPGPVTRQYHAPSQLSLTMATVENIDRIMNPIPIEMPVAQTRMPATRDHPAIDSLAPPGATALDETQMILSHSYGIVLNAMSGYSATTVEKGANLADKAVNSGHTPEGRKRIGDALTRSLTGVETHAS